MTAPEVVPVFLVLFLFGPCSTFASAGRVRFELRNPGDSITVNCRTQLQKQDSMYLYHMLKEKRDVLFLHQKTGKLSESKLYKGRLKVQEDQSQLSITIFNLSEEDLGVYWCMYSRFNTTSNSDQLTEGDESVLLVVNNKAELCGPVTRLTAGVAAVTAGGPAGPSGPGAVEPLVLVSILTAAAALLICVVSMGIWLFPKLTALCARSRGGEFKPNDTVYEDMRTTLRRP